MENGLTMNQELKQKQTISAYQYQSLHVLHLGNAQVGEMLKQEYLENPFIEQREDFSPEESQWLEYYKVNVRSSVSAACPSTGWDGEGEKEYASSSRDWRMDIKEQLYDGQMHGDRCRLLEQLLLLLDDHGFLAFSDQEGARLLKIPVKQFRKLREQLMNLEPEGLGCRSMGDYFLFQLGKKGIQVPDQFRNLCLDHLETITEMTYVQIARLIHVSFQEVKRWVRVLGTLEPYPVKDEGEYRHAEAVIPDIMIEQKGGRLEVRVNDYYMRQYCVSDFYRRSIGKEDSEELRQYMDRKLLRAKQLYLAVSNRNRTVQRMGEYLLELQKDFFQGGYLTGMTYRMFAEKLDIHESTVCRIVSNKYVHCPQGILPLRYFFSKGVAVVDSQGQDVGTMGKSSVKEIIALLIAHEPPDKPYSDRQLADMLQSEHGLRISRRTVSNYREEAGVRSVYERKI